jgi:hypothetical protein
MLERILVPLDGSDLAAAILPQVRGLRRCSDAEVIVVRAALPVYPVDTGEPGGSFTWPAILDEAESFVASWAKKLEDDGIRARGIARVGSPAEVILDHL